MCHKYLLLPVAAYGNDLKKDGASYESYAVIVESEKPKICDFDETFTDVDYDGRRKGTSTCQPSRIVWSSRRPGDHMQLIFCI